MFVIASSAALVGCGGHSSQVIDAPIDGQAAQTIQQIQAITVAPGTPVIIDGVIVTAVDAYGASKGDIWVEEPGGGMQSGIHVIGADPSVVATIQPGDVVDVTNAIKGEIAQSSDTSGRTEVVLQPPTTGVSVTLTKIGTSTVPAPTPVMALSIGMMADPGRSDAWRLWDGVLVTLTSVDQTSEVGQVPSVGAPDPTLQEFGITGVANVVSAVAAFPAGLSYNQCLASVTGIVAYSLGYEVLPRTASDVATGGSLCPPPESSMALCTDGLDNDGNGFKDCDDDGCIAFDPTCRSTVTVGAVDAAADAAPSMPTLPLGGPRGLQFGDGGAADVFVTAAVCPGGGSTPCTGFWVATSATAGSDGGLFVDNLGAVAITTADIGKTVELAGTLRAFQLDDGTETLPEMQALAVVTKSTAVATIVPVAGQTAAALTATATGRPYVGSLVTLTNILVSAAANPQAGNLATLQQGSTTFEAEADVHVLTSAAGTCFSSVTGVWTYDVTRGAYAFEPIAEGTVTVATACGA